MPLIMTRPFKGALLAAAAAVRTYVATLLKNDGTGTNNNTFVDQGLGAVPTPVGPPAQGSFSPFSPNGWSYEFDGASTVSFPAGQFSFGTGVYTVECFFTTTTNSGIQSPVSFGSATLPGGPTPYICLRFDSNELVFEETSTTGFYWRIAVPFKVEIGRTYHLAGVRGTSGLISLYLDGILQGTTNYGASMLNGYQCSVGGLAYGSSPFGYTFNGLVSNVRVSKTQAYTGPFTPPTSKLGVIANTVLLTAQDGSFIDRSSNNLLATNNGLPAAVPRSPFASVAWNAATHGGSMYADGVTQQAVDFAASTQYDTPGNWSLECWVYPMGTNDFSIYDASSGTVNVSIILKNQGEGKWFYQTVNNTITTVGAVNIPSNAWTHLAFTRAGSGGAIRTYVNGRADKSYAWTNITTGANGAIARVGPSSKSGLRGHGYISGFRITAATNYSAAFSMSTLTGPPTAIANTRMLLNFTDAAVVDSVNFVDVATFPGCTLSTDRGYGTGSKSLKFDGAGYASMRGQKIGTSDFTFESWVYPTRGIGQVETFFAGIATSELNISRNASGYLTAGTNGAVIVTSSAIVPTTTWTHIAVSRDDGVLRMFINGALVGSGASVGSFTFATVSLLGAAGTGRTNLYQGYMDDVTISLGDAKYKEAFTLPPSMFAYGAAMEGGYFYGVVKIDGVRYGLIMSPAANAVAGKIKTNNTSDGFTSTSDGWATTNALNNAEHPIYQSVRALNIGGYTDWYVPSIYELEPFYRNLKPYAESNQNSGNIIDGHSDNYNPWSDPVGAEYTASNPAITDVNAFRTGGAQQLSTVLVSSTTVQTIETSNYGQRHDTGRGGVINTVTKNFDLTGAAVVRPIRKFRMP